VRALLHKMPRGKFAHFARAYKQNALAIEGTEDLLCQVHCNRGNRNRGAADLRFAADFLRYRERRLQQPFKMRLHCAHGARDSVGFLDLAQDLGLAYYHRVQARRNTEEVPYGFALTVFVNVWTQLRRVYSEKFLQKNQKVGMGRLVAGQKLYAVAGGKHHCLAHAWKVAQGECCFSQPLRRNGKLLPQLNRSSLVVHTCQQNPHGVVYLWTELKRFAAHTQSITRKTALER